MSTPYHEQHLERGEIRLLFFHITDESSLQHVYPWIKSSPRSFTLVTKRIKLENTEKTETFRAVSYVWGTDPASVSISCNGSSLLVTPSVYEMLENLCTGDCWLWIDAICINQQDSAEKEIQVPLMHEIYQRANTVLIWMGPSTSDTVHFMARFEDVLASVKSWDYEMDDDRNPAYNNSAWPWNDGQLFTGLYRVLHSMWFKRLWTFQEAVLGKQLRITSGQVSIDGALFFRFVKEGDRRGGYLYPSRELIWTMGYTVASHQDALAACASLSWSHYRLHVQNLPVVDAQCVNYTLTDVQDLVVKEPVDRIWAIAGLFEQSIRDTIMPMVDYSSRGCLLYYETYLKFCTAMIARHKCLLLLEFQRPMDWESSGLISWCPDFSAPPVCGGRMQARWNAPISYDLGGNEIFLIRKDDDEENSDARRLAITEHSRMSATISAHDHILHIRGFMVDTVAKVVEDPILRGTCNTLEPWFWRDDKTDMDPPYQAVVQVFERLKALCESVAHDSNRHSRKILSDFFMIILLDCRVGVDLGDLEDALGDALMCLGTRNEELYDELEPKRRDRAWAMLYFLRSIADHAFFSTVGGRLGIGIPGIEPGDQVCTFYGGQELYILRRPPVKALGTRADAELMKFRGIAFVPHLMEQHERDSAKQGDDVVFKIK